MATETRETTLQMHNGTGGAGPFNFTFTAYEADDISVAVLNENEASADYGKYEPKTVDTHYTLDLTNKRITFTSGNYPATSTNLNIAIERRTDVTDASPRRTVFQAGSSIKAADLNQNQLQALDGVEDLWDKKISKLNPTLYGNFEFPPHQRFEGTQLKGDLLVREDKVVIFEGATDDGYETTLTVADPTADRTIVLPNVSGNIVTTGDTGTVTATMMAANSVDSSELVDGSIDASHISTGAVTADKLDADVVTGAKIADDAIDSEHYTDGSIDTAHIANNAVNGGKIAANSIDSDHYVDGSIDGVHLATGALDGRYYTETEADARFYKKTGSPDEVIKSDETWPTDGTKDSFVVTPGSVDLRIVSLVEEVGGFVAIDNETSFPNTNPDVNDGAGTIVSIKSLASPFTSSGSGVATIANGTIGNSTVTINGLANSTTYGAGIGLLVETQETLNTYKFHRTTPNAADVAAVAAKSTEVGRLGTADAVADMALLGTTDCVADMAILGTTDVVADLNTLATTDIVGDLDTVAGISAKVTTVADNNTNINTVSTNIASVNTCANNISDVSNFGDLYQIATSAPSNDGGGNSLAAGDLWFDSSSNKVLKVYDGSAFAATSPSQSVLNDIANVSGQLTYKEDLGGIADALTTETGNNINTVANNINTINSFSDQYRVASSAPSTSLTEGDLWYDSTGNTLKYYNGSAWVVTAAAGLSEIVGDTSPELGGHLDCNNKNLTEVGTVSGDNLQIDFGAIA